MVETRAAEAKKAQKDQERRERKERKEREWRELQEELNEQDQDPAHAWACLAEEAESILWGLRREVWEAAVGRA